MVEQSTTATHSLAHETQALQEAVSRFKVDQPEGARPSLAARR
jgi:hypothetical protein